MKSPPKPALEEDMVWQEPGSRRVRAHQHYVIVTRALDHQQNSAENKSAIAGLNIGVRRDQTRIFNLLSSQGFLANAIFAHRADDSFVTKRDVAIAKID